MSCFNCCGEDDMHKSYDNGPYMPNNAVVYSGWASLLVKSSEETAGENQWWNRIADVKEDAWESLYEKRSRKKALSTDDTIQHEVNPVDALPMKTLDGQLYYKTVSKIPNKFENANNVDETVGENEDVSRDNGVVKLTKAEKRAKFKKLRKEAKKQRKEVMEEVEEVQHNSQAEVLGCQFEPFIYELVDSARGGRLGLDTSTLGKILNMFLRLALMKQEMNITPSENMTWRMTGITLIKRASAVGLG